MKQALFVLGGPGSGKGTQCSKLAAQFSLVHLSAGELLRREMEQNTAIGMAIRQKMNEGNIVPVSISLGLLKREILSSQKEKFLVDGFPRNMNNLMGWRNDEIANSCKINAAVFLNCSKSALRERLLARALHSQRVDDSDSVISNRIKVFEQVTRPVLEELKLTNMLIEIDGNQTVECVYNDIVSQCANFLKSNTG